MGYTVVISGRMKCALLNALVSSLPSADTGEFWLGRSLESRVSEKKDCCGGGGFFKMDFPGVGIVTADDDGDGEEVISSSSLASVLWASCGRLIAGARPFDADARDNNHSLSALIISLTTFLTPLVLSLVNLSYR